MGVVRMRNIMRTSILSAFFGLLLIGCTTGEISGGGDDDDDGGPVCGNGLMEGAETCDDGNLTSGDGCSATCVGEIARVDVSVDMPSVNTELNTSTMLMLTVGGADGFRGPVNLEAVAVDAADVPVPGWTVMLSASTINVAYDSAPVTVVATLAIPSNTAGLMGSVKVTATSTAGAGNTTATTTVTALNQVTISTAAGTNAGTHPMAAATLPIKQGTKIRFKNDDTVQHITHAEGPTGFSHEDTEAPNTGAPGATYEIDTTSAAIGQTGQAGCHNHLDGATYTRFTIE